jgi:hypothetical protein
MNTDVHFGSYLALFFLEWEVFQMKIAEKINSTLYVQKCFFSRKSCRLRDNVEKYNIFCALIFYWNIYFIFSCIVIIVN